MPAGNHRLALPQTLYIETTNRCNLRCQGCILYRGGWESERDMSLQDLVMVADQLPELERAVLHGIGEPLLNKALPDMIRHLKKRNVLVDFNSNGILLNAKWQKDLMEAGLDQLRISLDAASPEGFHNIRNSNGFDQVMWNLRSFVKRQRKHHVTRPTLSLWYLGTRENVMELPNFIRLAADIGIGEVYLQRLVYFQDADGYGIARGDKTLQDSTDASVELIRKSKDLADRLGIRFNASGGSGPAESLSGSDGVEMPWRKCYRPSTLIYITANGNVLPCCISPFSTKNYASIILGNVFETSIERIWRGCMYEDFRRKRQTESPPVCCRGCGVLWSL